MKKIWNFFKWNRIKRVVKFIQQLATLNTSDAIYKVIDINPDTLLAAIKCINTPTKITDTIPHIIKDKDILAGLAPIDACWLGYYYGDAVQKKSATEAQKLTSDVNFLILNKRGKYRIHSLNRERTKLSYTDITSNILYEKDLILIAQDEEIINQFDPSQACYIGILVGLQGIKALNKKNHGKPMLTLIKDC